MSGDTRPRSIEVEQANTNQHFDKSALAGPGVVLRKRRLQTLPAQVQDALSAHKINAGHIRQLLRLQNSNHQARLCIRVIAEQLLVSELAKMVDEVVKLEVFDHSLQYGFSSFKLKFDTLYLYFNKMKIEKLYPYFTPIQFRHLMSDQFSDDDILDILETMYTHRYDHITGCGWQSQIDRTQLLTELKGIIRKAANTSDGYNIGEARSANELLALLKNPSHELSVR